MKLSHNWMLGTALASLMLGAVTAPAMAQDETQPQVKEDMTEVVVTGRLRFRDRANTENPTLVYKQDYFQRFEPVSVGEMLKRVPGVTFTSDSLEFDGVSMRGLPPGYTKILINGRRAPGGGKDRSFFVDRIPAELVERIEIIRSPSADQSSEGMAGSLNIVLKEGATLKGGLAKIGALINEDGKIRPSVTAAYAGGDDNTSWWIAANHQGRRNPKKKTSWRYDSDLEFDNIELQDDTRDGTDNSFNAEVKQKFDGGFVRFNGFAVKTDRDEDETSLTYKDLALTDFDESEVQAERIEQETVSLKLDGEFDLAKGELQYDFGYNVFKEDSNSTTWVGEEEDLSDLELDEYVETDITDEERSFGVAYVVKGDKLRTKVGIDFLNKDRDGAEVEFKVKKGVLGVADPEPGAIYTIAEQRKDAYVRLTYKATDALTVDGGLRLETYDRDVTSDLGTSSSDGSELNPSLHFTYRQSSDAQWRLSLARTVRHADYDLLAPYLAEEEPTDGDDLRGNPNLKNEIAMGLDAGYEHRLGTKGIAGINFFYRDMKDVIELIGTGETSSSGDGQIFEPRNIGDGQVWGAEIDFSSPLSFVGLDNTGVFFNYTWMDSEVVDPFTGKKRTMLNQPSQVYNVGFITTVPSLNASFGASLYDRDMGYEYAMDEEVTVDYEPSLEAFYEQRLGKKWVMRLSAHNILDAKKDETFRKFDGDSVEEILDNRVAGELDEYEVESEHSGVLYQVTLRMAF